MTQLSGTQPDGPALPSNCWLETWSQAAAEQGTRALDALRDGVQEAISALGRGFLALVTYAAITAVVWITYNYTHQYFTASSIVVGILMAFSIFGLIVVLLVEAHEWAEALWIKDHHRKAKRQTVTDDKLPLVSPSHWRCVPGRYPARSPGLRHPAGRPVA